MGEMELCSTEEFLSENDSSYMHKDLMLVSVTQIALRELSISKEIGLRGLKYD